MYFRAGSLKLNLLDIQTPNKVLHTHGVNNLPIPAIVYYINTLDIQLCRRGRARRGVPTILYVGEVFYKTITEPTYINFRSKELSGERLKLCLDFLCNKGIT